MGGGIMTEREFGNFSRWSLKDLIAKERSFTVGDSRGAELQAEINRRYAKRNQRYSLVNVISTVVIAFGTIAGIVYALDRGIYVGSTSYILPAGSFGKEDYVLKQCRYLFVTGLSEKTAHGGEFDVVPNMGGRQPVKNADRLYCRVFGE
jgi:hypothetical protein